MRMLLKHFPKEMAYPERIRPLVDTYEEFCKVVDKSNGLRNVYCSVYDVIQSPHIDKVVFDYDDGEASLSILRRCIVRLIELNWRFCCVFSGKKGFHLYVFIDEHLDLSTKEHLSIAVKYVMDRLGLTKRDIDPTVSWDVKRILRVPNTLHLGSGLYAIPLFKEEIMALSFEEIKAQAKQPKTVFPIYGKIAIKPEITYSVKDQITMETFDYSFAMPSVEHVKVIDSFLPCVKTWLLEPQYCKNATRWQFALYCRDIGLSPQMTDAIAKECWSSSIDSSGRRSKYAEFKQENQIRYARMKPDQTVMDCDSLYQAGFCKGKCGKYQPKRFPIYY